MTVLDFMRSYNDMATDKEYELEIRQNPGDGTSKHVYSGAMKDERYMMPAIRDAEIWAWLIRNKTRTIVVVIREEGQT